MVTSLERAQRKFVMAHVAYLQAGNRETRSPWDGRSPSRKELKMVRPKFYHVRPKRKSYRQVWYALLAGAVASAMWLL